MLQSLNPLILLEYNCQINFFKWFPSFQRDHCNTLKGFSRGSVVKNPPINTGDANSILGLGRAPEGGHGNLLQYSCLENPMDRGAWQATVHGVPKSRTRLKPLSTSVSKRTTDERATTVQSGRGTSFRFLEARGA